MSLTNTQQTLKDRTSLSTDIVKRVPDELAEKVNDAIEKGMKPNDAADLVESLIIEHQKKQYSEISEKIKEEVDKGDDAEFHHFVEQRGKEFVYKKCVQVDGQMYPIETKVCPSERQCVY